MIVNVNKTNFDSLNALATKKGVKTAVVIDELLSHIGLGNDQIKSVVLQIPVELLTNNKKALQMWLEQKSKAVLEVFYDSK